MAVAWQWHGSGWQHGSGMAVAVAVAWQWHAWQWLYLELLDVPHVDPGTLQLVNAPHFQPSLLGSGCGTVAGCHGCGSVCGCGWLGFGSGQAAKMGVFDGKMGVLGVILVQKWVF
jgi:hypothetical protein